MIPNLDFIKTLVNGLWFKIQGLNGRVAELVAKVHDPDYAAEEGEAGYIKNKPVLIGRPGEGEGSEKFNASQKAAGKNAHAEGYNTSANGEDSHAEGYSSATVGMASHAEGGYTTAWDDYSHAEGRGTNAIGQSQHVCGEYNVPDGDLPGGGTGAIGRRGKYVVIVGNGTRATLPSNAHTLDWDGNAWFAGFVEGTALILTSPGGKRFKITVDDDGTLQSAEVTA